MAGVDDYSTFCGPCVDEAKEGHKKLGERCRLTKEELKAKGYDAIDGVCPVCKHAVAYHPRETGKHTTTRYPPSLVPRGLYPSLPGACVRWWPFLPGSPSAVFPRWRFASDSLFFDTQVPVVELRCPDLMLLSASWKKCRLRCTPSKQKHPSWRSDCRTGTLLGPQCW